MRTIAIVNQKGGCGKTTTAINLASTFANRGQRVLLVDMDPQSHCAAGLGVPESRIEVSIAEALVAEHRGDFNAAGMLWEVARNFHLAPSTMRLAALEAPEGGLHRLPDKDRRLESLLSQLRDQFDICLIDCPPTIGLLTFNALRAAREVLIPIETGFFSLRGAEKQWQTIKRTVEHLGRPIACHMLATMHNTNSKTAREVLAALHRQFAGQIVPVVIHEEESIREATTLGQAIVEYAPGSQAYQDFQDLAQWLEDHTVRPEVHIEILPSGYPPEPNGKNPVNNDGMPSTRVSELVQRVRELAQRAEPQSIATAEPAMVRPDVSGLYGWRQTGQGVLFVQPGDADSNLSIAGTFNNWSTTINIMRFRPDLGVFEALIDIPPGKHEYLIVVDGKWGADPYNAQQVTDASGRVHSVIEVQTTTTTQ